MSAYCALNGYGVPSISRPSRADVWVSKWTAACHRIRCNLHGRILPLGAVVLCECDVTFRRIRGQRALETKPAVPVVFRVRETPRCGAPCARHWAGECQPGARAMPSRRGCAGGGLSFADPPHCPVAICSFGPPLVRRIAIHVRAPRGSLRLSFTRSVLASLRSAAASVQPLGALP